MSLKESMQEAMQMPAAVLWLAAHAVHDTAAHERCAGSLYELLTGAVRYGVRAQPQACVHSSSRSLAGAQLSLAAGTWSCIWLICVPCFCIAQGFHALAAAQWHAGRWGKRQVQWLADAHGKPARCIAAPAVLSTDNSCAQQHF